MPASLLLLAVVLGGVSCNQLGEKKPAVVDWEKNNFGIRTSHSSQDFLNDVNIDTNAPQITRKKGHFRHESRRKEQKPPIIRNNLRIRNRKNKIEGEDKEVDISHGASKSLSALKDRKEEILSELGNIVGTSNAQAIGDLASEQAASNERFGFDLETPDIKSRRNSLQAPGQNQNQQQIQEPPATSGTYGMWTSKPLVTMSSLYEPQQKQQQQNHVEDVEALPDGICVSRFGPISRQPNLRNIQNHGPRGTNNTEPRAVTAHLGQHTRPTSSVRQPLPATSPVPEGLMVMQDHQAVFDYDPDYYIQEGMDSVSMSHLINPPMMPISPLPNPRDQTQRLNSQNLSMYAESARIQKELHDLQRRISCLNVAENSNQLAMKRDRLAIELRYTTDSLLDNCKAV